MAELIAKIAETKGDRPALIDEYGTTTWAELDDRVNRAVEALRGLGLPCCCDGVVIRSRVSVWSDFE